jgi:hypothetical protein
MQAPRNCFAKQPSQLLKRVAPQRPCLKSATLTPLPPSEASGNRQGAPAKNSKLCCEVASRHYRHTLETTSPGSWDGAVSYFDLKKSVG